jgi:crotonobetainyl-CoA:carnitine CoA-transferase CaiB-like acyl-CoA transferase
MADDPHLAASGGLIPVTAANGETVSLPALPLALGHQRPGLRHDVPSIGGDGRDVLREIGYADSEIAALEAGGVLTVSADRR